MALLHFLNRRFAVALMVLVFSSIITAVTINVPADYSTIQAAIDAAVSDVNDIVIISPGTYIENINFNGKNFILTSMDPNDPDVVAATIIDGNSIGSVVTFSGTETPACILSGFTITNGGGGGIYGNYGNHTQASIANCTITGNTGSGLYYCDGAITNCTITGNTADYNGGGLYYCDGAITNCTITGNTADYSGGGLYYCDGSITNCTITGNTTDDGGGLHNCDGPITNCSITGNMANSYGGGLLSCDGTITNCTIRGNTAFSGGGLYECDGTITNCIVWHNHAWVSGDQIYQSSIPTHSSIQDWFDGGIGNISGDPMFADTSSSDPTDWDLRLLPVSPCVDTGTNTPPGGLLATDIEGFPRPFDGDGNDNSVADMGAYELHVDPNLPYLHVTDRFTYYIAFEGDENPPAQSLTITNYGSQPLNWQLDLTGKPDWLTVSPTSGSLGHDVSDNVTLSADITGLSRGLYRYSFEVADPAAQNSPQIMNVNLSIGSTIYVPGNYPTIQAAINDAIEGETIIVSPGTFTENINFNGKNIILASTDPENSNIVASTTIDGNQNGSVVTFSGAETSACVLKGFTITNGDKTDDSSRGGGIKGNSTQAWITNCIITGNTAIYGGGINSCNGIISNCTISGNFARGTGGLFRCNGTITDCIISNNYSTSGGPTSQYGPGSGGLGWCYGIIRNCTISYNTTATRGGGLSYCDGIIDNCTINDNTATYGGGGLYECNGTITNCTIAGNTAYWDGGGLYECNGSITHCTISSNTADDSGGGLWDCDGPISNCMISDNMTDGSGGGLGGCDGPITHCTIRGNSRGGLWDCNGPISNCVISENTINGGLADCDGSITNCMITDNTSSYYGGGLYLCDGSITNCIITGNASEERGGGLADCPGEISNCIITGNTSDGGGGLHDCNGPISNCIINGNTADISCGGLSLCGGSITNCTINGNTADFIGGGLGGCNGSITNCTIAYNTANQFGGGLGYCDGPITNCTIIGNTAGDDGGGLYRCEGLITNCIIWGNSAVDLGNQLYEISTTPIYSCIQDWTGCGIGNITSDPLLIDPNNGDFHLKSEYGRWDPNEWVYDDVTSPCIDAGNPEIMSYLDPNSTPTDPNDDFWLEVSDPNALWQNELWPHGGRINMGAYGGTPQASMSGNPVGNMADLDHDYQVGVIDLDMLCADWMRIEYLLDTDLNLDGKIDIADFADFAKQWLWGF